MIRALGNQPHGDQEFFFFFPAPLLVVGSRGENVN